MTILDLIQLVLWILGISVLFTIVCVVLASLKSALETKKRKAAEYERQRSYETQLQNKYKRFNKAEMEVIYRSLLECRHAEYKADADRNKAARLENRGDEVPIPLLLSTFHAIYLVEDIEKHYKIELESKYLSLDIGYLEKFISTNDYRQKGE